MVGLPASAEVALIPLGIETAVWNKQYSSGEVASYKYVAFNHQCAEYWGIFFAPQEVLSRLTDWNDRRISPICKGNKNKVSISCELLRCMI